MWYRFFMPEKMQQHASGLNRWIGDEEDYEGKGRAYAEEIVEKRNERAKPYRIPVRERAKMLGQQALFEETERYAKQEICDPLFQAFGTSVGEQEIIRARDLMRDELKFVAGCAREFAMHHSGYRVGVAVLALRHTANSTENPWVVLFDANTKLDEAHTATSDGVKWCGEMNSLDRIFEPGDASEAGIYRVVQMTIIGPARTDDRAEARAKRVGKEAKRQISLTPCHICRDRMMYDKKLAGGELPIMPPTTEIFSADAEHDWRDKLQYVGDLHAFHGEEIESDF